MLFEDMCVRQPVNLVIQGELWQTGQGSVFMRIFQFILHPAKADSLTSIQLLVNSFLFQNTARNGDLAVFAGKHYKISLPSVFNSASQCEPFLQFKHINSYSNTSCLSPLLLEEFFTYLVCAVHVSLIVLGCRTSEVFQTHSSVHTAFISHV